MPNRKSTLNEKTIVVTRPRNQSDKFGDLLEACGARVIFFPTIEIGPPESWNACDAAISDIMSYDLVVWTSANAVRMFCSRVIQLGGSAADMDGIRMIAVGRATLEPLLAFGWTAEIFDDVRESEDLIRHLNVESRRVLFPHGDKAVDRLPELLRQRHNHVTDVIVYRTQRALLPNAGELRDKIAKADAVTFFSPSSFESFLDFHRPDVHTILAAIGPTTARRIREAGYPCAIVSEKPDVESMVRALERYFEPAVVI